MRKFLSYTIFALFALVACNKTNAPELGEKVEFSFALPADEDFTKVSVDRWSPYDDYGRFHSMKWSNNDRIDIVYSRVPGKVYKYGYYSGDGWMEDDDFLRWNYSAGSQDFFGVYPETGNISIGTLDTGTDPERMKATVTASLPAVQDLTSSFGVNFAAYCNMVATKHVDVPGGSVTIPFSMFCTVVRLQIRNFRTNNIRLLDFTLTADLPVTGTYSGEIEDGQPHNFIEVDPVNGICSDNPSFTVTQNNIPRDVEPFVPSPDKTAYKTLFILPQKYTQFVLYIKVRNSAMVEKEETFTFTPSASGDMVFDPCRLHTLTVDVY